MTAAAKVIEFKVPKRRPKIIEKQAPPDQRRFAVVPMAALVDERLHHQAVRVLGLVCSYANRAGITWVGQQRIADHLKISKQAVNKAIKELKAAGYLELVSRGFRGEKADTLRVIYQPGIGTEDAISLASSIEDSRPPEQIRREARQMEEEPEFTPEQMAANRARLKEMLAGMTKKNHTTHGLQPIGELLMPRKPKPKAQPIINPQVDNQEGLHSQPIVNLQVDQSSKKIGIDKVIGIYEKIIKDRFSLDRTTPISEIDLRLAAILCELGVTEASFTDAVATMPVCLTLGELCEQIIHAPRY